MRLLSPRTWLTLALALAACRKPPAPASTSRDPAALCPEILVTELPLGSQPSALGRWRLTLAVEGSLLKRHEARFAKRGIAPNGEAWSGLLEQCLAKEGTPLPRDAQADPEAGSFSLWVRTERSRDVAHAAMCRAVNDDVWLDACLAKVDRDSIDD